MPQVGLTPRANEELAWLIRTHSLPLDTRERVRTGLRVLEQFPTVGVELAGNWSGLRAVLGPWRWMIIVYDFMEEDDLVAVLTIQDARSSGAPSS